MKAQQKQSWEEDFRALAEEIQEIFAKMNGFQWHTNAFQWMLSDSTALAYLEQHSGPGTFIVMQWPFLQDYSGYGRSWQPCRHTWIYQSDTRGNMDFRICQSCRLEQWQGISGQWRDNL